MPTERCGARHIKIVDGHLTDPVEFVQCDLQADHRRWHAAGAIEWPRDWSWYTPEETARLLGVWRERENAENMIWRATAG